MSSIIDDMNAEAEHELAKAIHEQRKAQFVHTLNKAMKAKYMEIARIAEKISDEDLPFYCVAIENLADKFMLARNIELPNWTPTTLLREVAVLQPLREQWDDKAEMLRARAEVLCDKYGHGDDDKLIHAVIAALSKSNIKLATAIASVLERRAFF